MKVRSRRGILVAGLTCAVAITLLVATKPWTSPGMLVGGGSSSPAFTGGTIDTLLTLTHSTPSVKGALLRKVEFDLVSPLQCSNCRPNAVDIDCGGDITCSNGTMPTGTVAVQGNTPVAIYLDVFDGSGNLVVQQTGTSFNWSHACSNCHVSVFIAGSSPGSLGTLYVTDVY